MKSMLTFFKVIISSSVLFGQVYVKQDASGANDGTSWINAFTNLQSALNVVHEGDDIWIAAGTYVPDGASPETKHFIVSVPSQLYGGFIGTETSLDQRDFEINKTIISGDVNGDDQAGSFLLNRTDNAHHVLIIDAGSGRSVIDGLIFKGGITKLDSYAPDNSDIIGYHRWRGGAVFINNSPTTVRHCVFHDNYGYDASALMARNLDYTADPIIIENSKFLMNGSLNGGSCNIWPWSNSYIHQCIFSDNISGYRASALAVLNSNALVEDCTFDGNFSSSVGGACYIWNNGLVDHVSLNFKGCAFNNNSASNGGGAILLICYGQGFDISIDSSIFNGNYTLAEYVSGGAIYIIDSRDNDTLEATNHIKIHNSQFSENISHYGAAIEIDGKDDSLDIEIQKTHFIANANNGSDDSGGTVYVWQPYAGKTKTRISNSLFKENVSTNYGGGLVFSTNFNDYPLSYSINQTEFISNQAGNFGGAIWSASSDGPQNQGAITDCKFEQNVSQLGGAIAVAGDLIIDQSQFENNSSIGNDPDLNDAGAIDFYFSGNIAIQNSQFNNNSSEVGASAMVLTENVSLHGENLIFEGNTGEATVRNFGEMNLINCTMVNNEYGLLTEDSSLTNIQNSIFQNAHDNLSLNGSAVIQSNGGNISNDATMNSYLTGSGSYEDLHNTDPLLGPDFYPLSGSPCIDAGNPDGILATTDLAGNPRMLGSGIDIGAFESFPVATHDVVWDNTLFSVYPNPVKDVIKFDLDNKWNGPIEFYIYNSHGQMITSKLMMKSTKRQTFSENISALPPGNYYLLVTSIEGNYGASLFIQQ